MSTNQRNFCPKPNQAFVLKALALKATQFLCKKKESIFCFYFVISPHEEPDLGSVEVRCWHRSDEMPISGLAASDDGVCLQRGCDSGEHVALHYPHELPSQVWCQAAQVLLSWKTSSFLPTELVFGKKNCLTFYIY